MSPRYYLVSGIIVVVLVIAISWWKQTKSIREVFIIFCQVLLLLTVLLCAAVGLVELLVYLGIAQSGFVIQQEELK